MIAQRQSSSLMDNIKSLEKEHHLITSERKEKLKMLALSINEMMSTVDSANVTFICTHNSRRSQLSEVWLRAAVDYFKIKGIRSYSGGTEATAFNHRMVAAIDRFGFGVNIMNDGINPEYRINMSSDKSNGIKMFSKIYDHDYNPVKNYIAVMVCDQADKQCPFIPGATERIALPYQDPKAYDDTPQESKAYDDKVREIGREILYMIGYLAT